VFLLLAERNKLNFNSAAAFRPDILHDIPDFLYPTTLENQTGRSIDGHDIFRHRFKRRPITSGKTLHGVVAGRNPRSANTSSSSSATSLPSE